VEDERALSLGLVGAPHADTGIIHPYIYNILTSIGVPVCLSFSASLCSAATVVSGPDTSSITLSKKLYTPSGTRPVPPHLGQGLTVLLSKITLVEFSETASPGKKFLHSLQTAGMFNTILKLHYKLQCKFYNTCNVQASLP